MRVRMLIDVEMSLALIPALADRISDQPVVVVRAESDGSSWTGRLMGATPVEAGDH